jgi:hypothetical protein
MLNANKGKIFNQNDIVSSQDFKKTIVNIDSRFRDNYITETTTNFTYKPIVPYKNIIKVALVSAEIPNVFYTFTEERHNITFKLITEVNTYDIRITEGNYTAPLMMTELTRLFEQTVNVTEGRGITAEINEITGKVEIYDQSGGANFDLDFETPFYKSRRTDWGLGYYLGFRNRYYTNDNDYIAESFSDVNVDQYVYLEINDYVACEQNTVENSIRCFAKIIIKENKYFTIFSDESAFLTNAIIFQQPQDISKFKIRLIDVFGETINLRDMGISLALELTEVINSHVYKHYLNYNTN